MDITLFSSLRTSVPNTVRLLLVFFILLQTVLPGTTGSVYAATTTVPKQDALAPPATIEPALPSPTEQTSEPILSTIDGLFDDVEIVPPDVDAESIETALPVPIFVRLEASSHLIRPGEFINLTVNAWRATEEKIEGLQLTLELPDVLKPLRGNTETQWSLPELESVDIFSRTVPVQMSGGAFPFETAVVETTLRTQATEIFTENWKTIKIGLESRAEEPPAAPVAKGQLRENGLVLRGRHGDVSLLVEAGSAETTTEFIYTDGYRWGEDSEIGAESITTPVEATLITATTSVTAANLLSTAQSRLYLPLVSGGGEEGPVTVGAAVSDDEVKSEAVVLAQPTNGKELLEDDGISFVRQWTLNATYQGEKRESFDKRIQMVIDATWLIEQDFDPTRLTLYTRATADQPWEEVPSVHYDGAQ